MMFIVQASLTIVTYNYHLLNVVMLSVVILSVIGLNVVAPKLHQGLNNSNFFIEIVSVSAQPHF